MIGIVVNGTPYTDFMSADVTVSLATLANDFQFTASSVGDFPPLRQGDAAEVLVDGGKILTGFIDEVGGKDQEGGHVVTYTGRDKTGDLLDSQINVINDIRASDSLTLKRLIEIVIEHLGLSIKVVDNLDPAPFNEAEDIIQPKVGQNAFEFISIYARKRQALLTSTADGDVLITQSSPVDSGATLQRVQGSDDNNILAQDWTINASQLFNRYIYRGQLDPGALNFAGSSDVDTITDQGGEATDSGIRAGRQSVHVEKDSYSSAQLVDRAKWGKQLATSKATRFNCTVKGHQMPQGGIWAVNTLAQINSDVADITRKMLTNTLTFSQGESAPTITRLEFVERNVYTINEKILAQRPAGDQNSVFGTLG